VTVVGAHGSHTVVTIAAVVVMHSVVYSVQISSSGRLVTTVVHVGAVQTEDSVQVEYLVTGTLISTSLVTQTVSGYEVSMHVGDDVTMAFVSYHVLVPVTTPSMVVALVIQEVLVS